MFSEEEYKKLLPIVSRPCILYGLPKIHKTNIPVSSILSAIGTHSYNLDKFLGPLLRPLSLDSLIIYSYSFIEEFSFLIIIQVTCLWLVLISLRFQQIHPEMKPTLFSINYSPPPNYFMFVFTNSLNHFTVKNSR